VHYVVSALAAQTVWLTTMRPVHCVEVPIAAKVSSPIVAWRGIRQNCYWEYRPSRKMLDTPQRVMAAR
jgi:hypothetical protein